MSMPDPLIPVTICTIAHNEAQNIGECIESVVGYAAQMVVLDASSSDRTAEIVREYQARHPEIILMSAENDPNLNVNKMRSFEPATQPWIFYLDADERMTQELWEEVRTAVGDPRYNGYRVGRKNMFFGTWLRWGGHYPDAQPRLFRRGKGSFAMEHVHESLQVRGAVASLSQPFIHFSYRTVAQSVHKMGFYTEFQARAWAAQGVRWSPANHWRLGVVRPFGFFFREYVLRMGFRDGFVGFCAAVVSGISEFLAYARVRDYTPGADGR